MTEILAALLGALVGALATYVLDIRKRDQERVDAFEKSAQERRLARQSVATALLIDVKRLETFLAQVYETGDPSRTHGEWPKQMFYDVLQQELRWFGPSSIQPVADFFKAAESAILDVRILNDVRTNKQTPTSQALWEARCRASFALRMVPDAARALQTEGGVFPRAVDDELYTYPHLPDVPKRVLANREVHVLPVDSAAKALHDPKD